jgi:hypothetical protein
MIKEKKEIFRDGLEEYPLSTVLIENLFIAKKSPPKLD